jgi:hypothetical protein
MHLQCEVQRSGGNGAARPQTILADAMDVDEDDFEFQ